MITWDRAYNRLKGSKQFASYFGGGTTPPAHAFRYIAFSLAMGPLTPSAAAAGGTFGATVGPTPAPFPAGCVILGITAAAFQARDEAAVSGYPPSMSPGRRDLFGLSFSYSSDENLTPNGLTMAEALLGSGEETIFPGRELVIPPSQNIQVSAASLCETGSNNLFVHIVFHSMVPRAVG